jgi:hypothetical protein
MTLELNLTFADAGHVQVSLRGENAPPDPPQQTFAPPLDPKVREELRWYLETYPVHYTTELDDERAAGVAGRLREWGEALFRSVFDVYEAAFLYERFRASTGARLLTISGLHPVVLGQPWELMCDRQGRFLFRETPRIPIRRRLPGTGQEVFLPTPKDTLRLLFVVSRPDDAGFLDPRTDPMAVMDAIDAEAPGRIVVEFLRPPTLARLLERPDDTRVPPVDILHFDGHGAYGPDGRLAERSRQAPAAGGS